MSPEMFLGSNSFNNQSGSEVVQLYALYREFLPCIDVEDL